MKESAVHKCSRKGPQEVDNKAQFVHNVGESRVVDEATGETKGA